MLKRFLTATPLAFVALALAQNATVIGAKGEGLARSEDGRNGKFKFNMAKAARPNGAFRIEGQLRFESNVAPNTGNPGRHVVIEMGDAKQLSKENKVVEFGGPGVIVVRTRDGVVRHEGRVSVRVEDRRSVDQKLGMPDYFRIGFAVQNSDAFFRFDGKVVRGDILVFKRPN